MVTNSALSFALKRWHAGVPRRKLPILLRFIESSVRDKHANAPPQMRAKQGHRGPEWEKARDCRAKTRKAKKEKSVGFKRIGALVHFESPKWRRAQLICRSP